MLMNDIIELWEKDSQINRSDLIGESLRIPQLHQKYYKIYLEERKLLKEHEENFKTFEYHKWMYYQGKLSEEDIKKYGWQQCDIKYLKTDIQKVVDADSDIIERKLKIARQQEKTEYIKSIIQSLNNRSFLIGHAIEAMKFEHGIN